MQKIIFLAFFFTLLPFSNAQNTQLSPDSEISVLTVGPGNSLYDAFGHSAFRIKDKSKGLDIVYGYGEYDFNAPNFYLKFAQGKLNYLLSKDDFSRFYRVYEYYDRSIDEQILNLRQSEKQKLYDYLINNYKPENRRYLYDFFFDNCATRIKEVANNSVNQSITFNTPSNFKNASFRTLIQNNLNKNSWGSLGIDIALGSVIDQMAQPENHMFLPENIYSFFENATYGHDKRPLIKKSNVIYKQKEQTKSSNFFLSPLFIFGIFALLIIGITYRDYKTKKQSKWLDIILFVFTGLAGIILLLLWFATNHEGTRQNYNLLWAFALNIFVIGQFFKQKVNKWFIKYIKLLIILLCLMALHWSIGVQVFAIGLIPFLIALAFRYIYLVYYYTTN